MSLPPIVALDLTERSVQAQEAVAASLAILASHVVSPSPERPIGYAVVWRADDDRPWVFDGEPHADLRDALEADRAATERYPNLPHAVVALVPVVIP